jgi:formate hydrogenlyase subunit 6/NADH:ubiquinone oxidoreductase subunit I
MKTWLLPTINMAYCTGCGLCVERCPTGAVEMEGTRPVIRRPHDCAYCGECEELCPAGAIALQYEFVIGSPSDEAGEGQ